MTDHRALVTLMTAKQENRRLHNWSMKLTEFKFSVEYCSGKENIVADCLSRCYERDGEEYCADGGHQQRRRGGGRCGPAHMKWRKRRRRGR